MLSIFFRSWILKSYYLSSEKEKENPRLLSTSSIKREIGKFHVGVVQRSTAKKWTKLLFCQSILPFSLPPPSSLLKLSDVFLKRPLKKVLWKLRSPRGYFRKFSLSAGVQNSGNVFQSNVSFLFLFLLGIWYSPSQPFLGCHETLPQRALRDIQKTAARETRDLAAVCIFGHVLKDDRRSHSSLLLENVFPEVIKPSCNRAHQALS